MENIKIEQKSSGIRTFLYLVLSLFLICTIVSSIIAGVYLLTKNKILENIAKDMNDKASEIFGDEIILKEVEFSFSDTTVNIVYEVKKSGSFTLGYLVRIKPSGSFSGNFDMIVGIDLDGVSVLGVRVIANAETPGLGSRAIEISRLELYRGLKMEKIMSDDGVDFIAGATYTSSAVENGVVGAINAVIEYLEINLEVE